LIENMTPQTILPTLLSPPVVSFLRDKYDMIEPRKVLERIRNGESVRISHERTIHPHDIIGASRRGRKICILGDTCDSTQIASMAAGCDVLVHESTNGFMPGEVSTDATDKTKEGVVRSCVRRGHSSPEMAGAFASAIGCKKLVLTHFGAKLDSATATTSQHNDGEHNQAAFKRGRPGRRRRGEQTCATFDHQQGVESVVDEQLDGGVGGLTPTEIAMRSLPVDVAEQLLSLVGETYTTGKVVLARDFLEVPVTMSQSLSVSSTANLELEAADAAHNAARSAERYVLMSRGNSRKPKAPPKQQRTRNST
jgi:hypothetical protein